MSAQPRIPDEKTVRALLAEAERGDVSPERVRWLGALIDHTLLKPGTTEEQLSRLCREAREHGLGVVCVSPEHVAFCVNELKGSAVRVAAVAGFPTGLVPTAAKVADAKAAVAAGAQEIDMVLNVEALKKRDLRFAFHDIQSVVQACGAHPVKVILETCLLGHDEKLLASALAKAAGAAFLKTSTGFSTGGATAEDVALLRSVARADMGVKASGGVRSLTDALRMVLAGADRIGTSAGVAIVGGKSSQPGQSGVY